MKLPAGIPDSGFCPKENPQTLSAPGDVPEDMVSDRSSTLLTSTSHIKNALHYVLDASRLRKSVQGRFYVPQNIVYKGEPIVELGAKTLYLRDSTTGRLFMLQKIA